MDNLFNLAKKNKSLKYLDTDTGAYYAFRELELYTLPKEEENCLAFLYLDNSIKAIQTLWSFWKENYTVALLDPGLDLNLKRNIEKIYAPTYIYDPLRSEIINFRKKDNLLNGLFHNSSIAYNINPSIKLLLSTSGTTGSPKLVKLSEENIVQNALSIIDYLPISKKDVAPLNLPLFYSYGFSIFTTNAIAGGTTVCTNSTVLSKEFWSDFANYKYTTLAGVPFIYEMLNRLGFTKKSYASLRYITQAGGKLNEKLISLFSDYCKKNKILFFTMYGQTEATARISFLHPSFLPDKIGSIGIPIKHGKFKIDSETNELLYSGPNIFGGYCKNHNDLNNFEKLNWLKTGDLAYKDSQGFYYIKGRIKRFVKLFGKRINLDDLDNHCKTRFEGRTFATVGLNDKKILIAYQGGIIELNEIKTFVKNKFDIHPSVIKEIHLEQIPLTSNGKPNFKELVKTYTSISK